MKYSFSKTAAVATAVLATSLVTSPTANAAYPLHHGTACMTANLAQGQLFTWNKDGITNNAAIPLFIICPVTYDYDDVRSFATPRGFLVATVYYPPSMPLGSTIDCSIRVSIPSQPANGNASDSQNISTNLIFSVGSQSFSGIGDVDSSFNNIFDLTTAPNGNVHLLCLMPSGSTFTQYGMEIRE